MNTGNLQAVNGRIREALEQLQLAWHSVSESWQDANAARFEEQYLAPVQEEFQAALPAIGQLAQIVQAAARELEE